MAKELYRKHRPRTLQDVVGNDGLIRTIEGKLKKDDLPHAIMLTGPPGCGKTTIARILARVKKCSGLDLKEINAASSRGVDTVRDVEARMNLSPMGGDHKFYIFDEAHMLVTIAQNALLKMLEDTPDHVHFILCTTDPHKLIRTIKSRCTEWKVALCKEPVMAQLLQDVCKKEKAKISKPVVKAIIDSALGSPRKALVLLHSVIDLETEAEQLVAISKADSERQAFDLVRMLLYDRNKTKWERIADLLANIEDDAEQIRRLMMACASKVMLSGKGDMAKAYDILDVLRDPLYDSGFPGLVRCCWEIFTAGK